MGRQSIRLITLSLCLLAANLGGCRQEDGASYNSSSGLDGRRDTATRLYLGTSQDDRCDAGEGDNEDWRFVLIRQPGVLNVSVGLDNPGSLEAELYLHDGFGRPIDRIPVHGDNDFYSFQALPVTMGRYYFRIVCNQGTSVYTVAAEFQEDRPERVDPVKVYRFEPEPKPEPALPPQRKSRVRPSSGSAPSASAAANKPSNKPAASTSKPKADPKATTNPIATSSQERPPEDLGIFGFKDGIEKKIGGLGRLYQGGLAAPPKKVEGLIILITPSQDGLTKLTMKNVGTETRVSKDMVGSLTLSSNRQVEVKLFDCEEKRCVGSVDASPEEIGEVRKVIFQLPPESE